MAASPASSKHRRGHPHPRPALHRPRLSDAVVKVDRAVARLEELQCLVRTNHTNNVRADTDVDKSSRSEKAALSVRDNPQVSSSRCSANAARGACPGRLMASNQLSQRPEPPSGASSRRQSPALANSRRSSSRPVVHPPRSPPRKTNALPRAGETCRTSGSLRSSPLNVAHPSPPSSACSSSVPTRRPPVRKAVALSTVPKTFIVEASSANPNRPWHLSASPSPAVTSSTTSNCLRLSSSNSSSAALPIKSPSRFSPLYRTSSSKGCKNHEVYQSLPLLSKGLESLENNGSNNGSPLQPRKVPWLNKSRPCQIVMDVAPSNTKRASRRFSFVPNTHAPHHSPPTPLPALITRLPMRRKGAMLSPDKKGATANLRKSSPSSRSNTRAIGQRGLSPTRQDTEASMEDAIHKINLTTIQQYPDQKLATSSALKPLPLPPALQGQRANGTDFPSHLTGGCKSKGMHRRSISCPRQCFVPVNEERPYPLKPGSSPSQVYAETMLERRAYFHSSGKENCFPGCCPAAWPRVGRSWSFSQQPSLVENLTGAGPFIAKHLKGCLQQGTSMNSHVYKVDYSDQDSAALSSLVYKG